MMKRLDSGNNLFTRVLIWKVFQRRHSVCLFMNTKLNSNTECNLSNAKLVMTEATTYLTPLRIHPVLQMIAEPQIVVMQQIIALPRLIGPVAMMMIVIFLLPRTTRTILSLESFLHELRILCKK